MTLTREERDEWRRRAQKQEDAGGNLGVYPLHVLRLLDDLDAKDDLIASMGKSLDAAAEMLDQKDAEIANLSRSAEALQARLNAAIDALAWKAAWKNTAIQLRGVLKAQDERVAKLEAVVSGFYDAIAHGDAEHQEWLRAEVDSYLALSALDAPSDVARQIEVAKRVREFSEDAPSGEGEAK